MASTGSARWRAVLGLGRARLTSEQQGVIAVHLALFFPHWVTRRMEGLSFIDDTTVRERTSVTFRWPLPEFFPPDARPVDGDVLYVPLAIPPKRTLAQLDVSDEQGATFAVLATRENGDLAAGGLISAVWGAALQRHGTVLSGDAVARLEAIVTARGALPEPLLGDVRDRPASSGASCPFLMRSGR